MTGALDAVVLHALQPAPDARFESAHAMATAIEAAVAPAGAREVSTWLASAAGGTLASRAALLAAAERGAVVHAADAASIADLPTDVGLAPAPMRGLSRRRRPPLPSAAPHPAPSAWTRSATAPARSRRLALGAGAAVLAVGLAAWLSPSANGAAADVAHIALAGWVAGNATPSPPHPADDAPVDPVAPAAPPASPPAAGIEPSTHLPARPPVAAMAAPSASARAQSCKPAYTIGDDGIRRFKPWCVPGAKQAP
ncbi:MAG: hypothetical protein WKG00_24230 [Polyangiaceae bacterium]